MFLATEHGHKFIRTSNRKYLLYFETGAAGWNRFKRMLEVGAITKRKPKTVCVDTTTKLYERCLDSVCKDNGWKHPGDAPHGKGWHAVRTEFGRQLERLTDQCAEVGATLVFLDHTDVTEVDAVVMKYHKMQCAMPTQPRSVVLPVADHIMFLGYEHFSEDSTVDSLRTPGNNRCLWIGGSETIEAGSRDPSVTVQVVNNLPKKNPFEFVQEALSK